MNSEIWILKYDLKTCFTHARFKLDGCLRHSGCIRQKTDIILLTARDDYHVEFPTSGFCVQAWKETWKSHSLVKHCQVARHGLQVAAFGRQFEPPGHRLQVALASLRQRCNIVVWHDAPRLVSPVTVLRRDLRSKPEWGHASDLTVAVLPDQTRNGNGFY